MTSSRLEGRAIPVLLVGVVAIAAAVGAGAWYGARDLERRAAARAAEALDTAGQGTWAAAVADGLRITLNGEAPDQAARLSAVRAAMLHAGAARVIDATTLAAAPPAKPEGAVILPPPALTLTREGTRIAIAGRLPKGDVDRIAAQLVGRGLSFAKLAMPAAPPPDAAGWTAALDLAVDAALALHSARAELSPGTLEITGWAESDDARRMLEAHLRATAPPGLALNINVTAPPPAFRPFRFAATRDAAGARAQICHVQDAAEGAAIAAALHAIAPAPGAPAPAPPPGAPCLVGVGAPVGDWGEVALAAISAIAALPAARIEITDRDVTLHADAPTRSDRAKAEAQRLSRRLGAGWALHVDGPPRIAADPELPEDPDLWFAVRRWPGRAALRGRAPDAATRTAVIAYARAMLGAEALVPPAVNPPDLAPGAAPDPAPGLTLADTPAPPAWRRAALATIATLGHLDRGVATFDGHRATVSGVTTDPDKARAAADALRALEDETGLETASSITIDLPARAARLPLGPERCLEALLVAQAADPIRFEPGSPRIIPGSARVLDALAAILRRCGGLVVEIEGHTDSQGRETTNQALSRGRAEAVLTALHRRGAPLWMLAARGFGETRPIADNTSEDGRAANRRIEFSNRGPAPDFAPPPMIGAAGIPPTAPRPQPDAASPSAASPTSAGDPR
ncbi:MAG: OOP family OmpA-OmpF porin [Paracoccaceae bacterium]|jgi:OOP family OmpA-OmpF porin